MRITKSDFTKHEECPIWLWLIKHRPDLLPEDSPELERLFEKGREVDQLAKSLYPGGLEIQGYNEEGWENTQKAISTGASTILFQPTAVTPDGLSARADILQQSGSNDVWDLLEVKMSTSVKPEHLIDVAFQRICFEDAGIRIGKTYLVHINKDYVRRGDIDPEELFIVEDITDSVLEGMSSAKNQIEEAKRVVAGTKEPDELLIHKCEKPKRCEYLGHYVHGIAEVHGIADRISEDHLKALLERGLLNHSQIDSKLLKKVGFEPEVPLKKIDAKGIQSELSQLEYPIAFFDYETYGPAIPLFDGLRPYQQMPFQYSCDIRPTQGADIEHKEYIASSLENAMPSLLKQLRQDIPKKGSVIVWNASFEKTRKKEMAAMYPEYATFLNSLNERMFDLMLLFKLKKGLYLNTDFQKSASLKAVLPVICPDLKYENLKIQGGQEASSSWPKLVGIEDGEVDRKALLEALLEYCARDTFAMVCILDRVSAEAEAELK